MFWESLAHQWAADYFLVRMVVPGTKPVENPCNINVGHQGCTDCTSLHGILGMCTHSRPLSRPSVCGSSLLYFWVGLFKSVHSMCVCVCVCVCVFVFGGGGRGGERLCFS